MKKEVFLIAISASIAIGANNQKDLDLINANAAYDQGFKGEGINIGVIDGAAKENHPSLDGQLQKHIYSTYNGKPYSPNFIADTHGTHVTSIIVGKDFGNDAPHGVAYNAKSYNVQISGYVEGSNKEFAKITDFFESNNVKIINNSWNANYFPLVGTKMLDYFSYENQGYEYWFNEAYKSNPVSRELVNFAKNDKALVLFATGNEGIISPGLYATLRSQDESLKAFMAVGSVDSNHIIMTNGKVSEVKALGISLTGNGFKKATHYGLVAPGVDVLGAYPDKDGYIKVTGTSQATPYVSGAAALVMEKFPFLKPSQVADVLLSTANRDFKYPKVALKETSGVYTIFYIDATAPSNNDQIRNDLLAAGYDSSTVNKALASKHQDSEYPLVQNVSFADIFGQGILDIQKAMGGLAVLDANRLSDDDIKTIDKKLGNSKLEANPNVFYTIDINKDHGDGAEFSNDISQKQWEESTHLQNRNSQYYSQVVTNKPTKLAGLNVGLRKTGNGTLILSGKNSYAGATLVEGGELVLNGSISNPNNDNGNIFINTQATFTLNSTMLKSNESLRKEKVTIGRNVLNEGLFRGIGTIDRAFINRGVLRAGFYDAETQSTLTKNDILRVGTFIQDIPEAELQLAFTKQGNESINSQLIATNYRITNGKLVYVPLHSTENLLQVGETININIDDALLKSSNLNISVQNRNLINFELGNDKKTITVTMSNAPVTPSTPTDPSPTNPESGGTDSGSTGGDSGTGSGGGNTGGSDAGAGGSGSQSGSGTGGGASGGNSGTGGSSDQGSQGGSSGSQGSSGDSGNSGNSGSQSSGSQGGGQGSSGSQPSTPTDQGGQGQGSQTPSNPTQPSQPSNPTQPSNPSQPSQPQTPGDTGNNQSAGNGNTGAGNQNQNNPSQGNQGSQNPVAPSSPNAPIKALQELLANASTLSTASTAALASLDNLPSEAFSDAINAMKDTPTATNINAIETMQKDLSIKSTLFLLDPASSIGALNTASNVFAPTAAFGDEYLGKVDDVFIKTELSAGIAYRRTNHDDYTQNTYLLDLQGKKALSDTTLLGGYIGLSHSKTQDDLSDIRSNMFSLGLSLNHSFDSFGVLLGASAGMSFNRYEQSIKHLSNAKSDANYKNYFANLQAGVYKSFKLSEALALTPIAMFDYSVIKQDSFSQSGALAKNYEAKTTHFGRGWLGANLVYNAELENKWRFNTSLFAFYWRKFNHKDINQNLSFVEAREQRFAANTSRSERQGFYGGIAFGASKDNKFFRISISDEKARAYNQYEIMLRAGISF